MSILGKHFSDLTISNFGEHESSFNCTQCHFQSLNARINTADHIPGSLYVEKRSAQSLNDIQAFKISDEPDPAHSDHKTRSLSEIQFRSVEINNSIPLPKMVTPLSIAAKNLIKNMAKKKIKFASVQSAIAATDNKRTQTIYRKSEVNPMDIQAFRRKSLNQREKNITYKLGFIMLAVLISWLPIAVCFPLSSMCLQCIPKYVYLFSLWLTYVNSLLSPLILISSNSKYTLLINLTKNLFYKWFSNICLYLFIYKSLFNNLKIYGFLYI